MKKNPNITIIDIAKALNVSKSTVSRALNDSHDINPDTKKKILEFAEKNDYRPDFLGRGLRNRSSKTIGVIIPAYNIPFYSIAICGIQDYAMKHGYNVMVCHSRELYDVEIRNVEALLAANVDGMIISVACDTEKNGHIHRLKQKGVPLVLFNRVIENFKAAKVVVNDYYGAYNMVKFLVGTGCKNFAHLAGPSNLLLSINRKTGYLDAIKDAGIIVDIDLISEGDFTIVGGYDRMKKLLETEKEIDAVFCICDAVAFGAMRAIKESGKKIPDDISVAGFTNEPMSEIVEPTLTTVRQPIYEIGETAARLLFEQFADPDLPAQFCVIETDIVVRNSTRKINIP